MATLGGRGRGEEEPAARSAEEPVIFHKPISNFVGSKRVIKKRRMQSRTAGTKVCVRAREALYNKELGFKSGLNGKKLFC